MNTKLVKLLSMILIIALVASVGCASAFAVQSGYINGDGVAFRSGPGTGYSRYCYLSINTPLTITAELNSGWCAVNVNGTNGYVWGAYVSKGSSGSSVVSDSTTLDGSSITISNSSATTTSVNYDGYINRDSVNFRSGPGTGYAVIGTYDINTKCSITAELNSGWCRVIINGYSGYVYGAYVSKGIPAKASGTAGCISNVSYPVNFRTAPNLQSSVISTVTAGTSLTIVSEESNGFCGVIINGVRGYVYGSYVSKN